MSWRKIVSLILMAGMLFSQLAFHSMAATYCNWAQFVSDLSVPDGTPFAAGTIFTKTWRLKNIGSCTWDTTYSLVFVSGDSLGAPASINLPKHVTPGQRVDLSVVMTAPSAPGIYRGFWKLSDGSGTVFGIGSSADKAFWVEINVLQEAMVTFDLVASAPYAQWKSGAGPLPFPGTSGDYRGYAQVVNYPNLEDGAVYTTPGLLTVPQYKYNGFIQATYPEYTVQQGDRFQSVVGCEYGTSCYVTFRLDYVTTSGKAKTFWTRREMNDRRAYQVNLDLSPLAGQSVRFVLMMLATGSAEGDRAIWGSPRIVRAEGNPPPITVTPVPYPTMTPSPTPFASPPPIVPSGCDKAAFVADITVPDGTLFAPGAAFSKTWRLKNVGSCAWTTDYKAIFYSGGQMNAPTAINLPAQIAPGQSVDLTINMTAPTTSGLYRGNWVLSNPAGALFGISSNADMPFWLQINVSGGAPVNTGYDFTENVCAAQWKNGAGALPCPGVDADIAGFVVRSDAPHLEDGSAAALPGLLTGPQFKYNGYIQGIYPAFTVQPGDHFQSSVGCEYGANCYVTFRLETMTAAGSTSVFWSWREQNDGRFYNADINLTPLAGQSVRFILSTLATGYPYGDRAIWGAPRIVRAASIITPTFTPSPTPTLTPTSEVENGLTYTNTKYGFQFKYPSQGQIMEQDDNHVKINLPFAPGTNLREKYLSLSVIESPAICNSPFGYGYPPEMIESSQVVINGINFLKERGADGAAGSLYQWTAYSTLKDSVCVSFSFMLHSINPGNYFTPPPVFDEAAESAVFEQIAATLVWIFPVPDLAITQMRYELQNPGCLMPEDPLGVRLWVKNQGRAAAASFTVQVNEAQQSVSGLGVGETIALFFVTSSPGFFNPVTAVVDPANMAAESNESNNSRTETLPVPTPPLPCTLTPTFTPTPTVTPTPVTLIGPYAVILVSLNDVLNIRSDAGADYPIVGSFPWDAVNVMRTGPTRMAGDVQWVEVARPDGSIGWVNAYYLTEYVAHESFCGDARVTQLIDQLKQSVNQSNGNQFASLVSLKHSARINYWRGAMPVNYTTITARTIFTDPQMINWGAGPSGTPDVGTFAQIVQPDMAEVLNISYRLYCDDPSYANMFVDPWLYTNIHYYSVLKPPTPGIDLDWKNWLIGFEYLDGVPYLFGTVHYVWEP
ncbi:MAG: hypothetical protein HZB19_02385 [Chloroflexi bacterium]|nr:hypothetical protein [Chloroflexota bacterium]